MNQSFAFAIAVLCITITLRAEAPRVVKATPDNGATDVDPNLKQIEIVFDQAMNHGGRSIVGGGPTFPKFIGQPRWTNDRTIVIPVQLEADHDYWLSINNQTFRNFKNTLGESAVPYPISFSTSGGKKLTAEENRQAIERLRKAIHQDYSYFDLRKVDWDKVFVESAPKLEQSNTARAFARQAGEMLAVAQDIHLYLKVGESSFPSFRRSVPGNADLRTLSRIVPQWKDHDGVVATGRFEDGVSYVMIASWGREVTEPLEAVYEAIGGAGAAKGMIIDVRANGGGDETLAQKVAGCFIVEPKLYSKNAYRKDGQWGQTFDRIVMPNKSRPAFRGKVAVLIGPVCMSSNESFILMMKAAGATLVGAKTWGSSGNPKPHDLGNGVTVVLPSWKDLLPDGSLLEGVGIAPDIDVKATAPGDFRNGDPVLEAALKHVRGP
jgi:hypothetical protein